MPRTKKPPDPCENFCKPFAVRLRMVASSSGYTQQDISDKTGIPRQAIGRYMNGEVSPNADTLVVLSQGLGVSSDWLLGLSDTTVPPDKQAHVTAVCAATGLSGDAVKRLIRALSFQNSVVLPMSLGGKTPLQVLSEILSDAEFWRAINNVSQLTSNMLRELMAELDAMWFSSQDAGAQELSEFYLYNDRVADLKRAGIVSRLNDVVCRVLDGNGD